MPNVQRRSIHDNVCVPVDRFRQFHSFSYRSAPDRDWLVVPIPQSLISTAYGLKMFADIMPAERLDIPVMGRRLGTYGYSRLKTRSLHGKMVFRDPGSFVASGYAWRLEGDDDKTKRKT